MPIFSVWLPRLSQAGIEPAPHPFPAAAPSGFWLFFVSSLYAMIILQPCLVVIHLKGDVDMAKVYRVYTNGLSSDKVDELHSYLDAIAFMVHWNPEYLQITIEDNQVFPPPGFSSFGCKYDDVTANPL